MLKLAPMKSVPTTIGPILYCECAYTRILPEQTKRDVRQGLQTCGRDVVCVPDLCALAANRDPWLARIAGADSPTVIACYPRAVRWLFHWAGTPLAGGRVQLLNMRVQSARDILTAIGQTISEPDAADLTDGSRREATEEAVTAPDWQPWFPVIDYDRCTNCRQCLEFCLFGVYDVGAAGEIEVRRPTQCKNNCPACARMCPAMAIMFPKIDEASPISGNDDARDAAAGKVCLTREQLFGGNLLERLRARRRPPLFKT